MSSEAADALIQWLSHVQLFASPWTQHARLPCPSLSPGVCSNPCPSSQWCHPTISSSAVVPFSSCPQSFPALRSFLGSQLFASGGQSIGASPLASVLPMNVQHWFPLGSRVSLWSQASAFQNRCSRSQGEWSKYEWMSLELCKTCPQSEMHLHVLVYIK